jgi:bifunctional UDP-N-acetylglucosamine pyrophosphorylase/glucosamine-1-phosphate N-acetyltransferase
MNLNVVILAAGHGNRMQSDLAKVLHPIGGIPMLERIVNTVQLLKPHQIHIVYGNHTDNLRSILSHLPVNWVCQKKQLGTAHALMQALPFCHENDRLLSLFGDVPLISTPTLKQLLDETPETGLGIVVTEYNNPTGFGRIIRNEMGQIIKIVEEKDATCEEKKIKEVNTGILTASAHMLKEWLPKLKNKNAQHEYYLTDIISVAAHNGYSIGGVFTHNTYEVKGVNDKWQLMQLERHYQYSLAKALALSGVTIMDAKRLDIRSQRFNIQKDVRLDVDVILEGQIEIGTHSLIGANVILKNVKIGKNVIIHPNTIIENAEIGDNCEIGPYARIRPGTVLESNVKVGNFVELKKTHIESHSKANHLTYLGDAHIGEHVNIGAGTITCNYDGAHKYRTTIKSNAFIGANSTLVAPITIGEGATIGAGSTISKDAIAQQLTIARSKQSTIRNWKRPKKKK